jgi:hypothetical protein
MAHVRLADTDVDGGGGVRAVTRALMSAVIAMTAWACATAAAAQPRSVDYMNDAFDFRRVLNWGTRPVWSPDAGKLVFTEADTLNTQAYELDLQTGNLRCLTCFLGVNGRLSRIYYLPSGDFLILAPDSFGRGNSADVVGQDSEAQRGQLFWMSSAPHSPPQSLGVAAFGDSAISRRPDSQGNVRIAWGETDRGKMLLHVGTLVVEGGKARLTDRSVVYDSTQPRGTAGATIAEAYDFLDNDRSVVFATVVIKNGVPDAEMYKVDVATGALTNISRDPHLNETHVLPDERFGLEESNRASDPNGRLRGVSGIRGAHVQRLARNHGLPVLTDSELANYAPLGPLKGLGRPFDIYVTRLDGTAKPRRLTNFSHLGGNAHQSSASPDGRRVAFALISRGIDALISAEGLYVGEFKPEIK